MYREPHLQEKSDECAALWREWHTLWRKKTQLPLMQGKMGQMCDGLAKW